MNELARICDQIARSLDDEARPGLTLISWETTMACSSTGEQIETLMAMDAPRAEFFRTSPGRQPSSYTSSWGARCSLRPTDWRLLWHWSRVLCARPRRTMSRSS
jgi:hypothetical protein